MLDSCDARCGLRISTRIGFWQIGERRWWRKFGDIVEHMAEFRFQIDGDAWRARGGRHTVGAHGRVALWHWRSDRIRRGRRRLITGLAYGRRRCWAVAMRRQRWCDLVTGTAILGGRQIVVARRRGGSTGQITHRDGSAKLLFQRKHIAG